jgi:hypothetical protein
MTTNLMASIAFGGGLGDSAFTTDFDLGPTLDPDLAADEPRQGGHDVFRLPDKYGAQLAHPLDDFIEAVILDPNDPKVIGTVMDEVDV